LFTSVVMDALHTERLERVENAAVLQTNIYIGDQIHTRWLDAGIILSHKMAGNQ